MPAPKGNKNALNNKGGRPPLFDSPSDLENKISDYINGDLPKRQVVVGQNTITIPVPTISGLAYYLGFESRFSFYDYEKRVEFSHIIKRARLFIESQYEEQLKIGNVTGAIFALKNMGWSDKTELEHSGNIENGTIKIEYIKSDKSISREEPTE